MLRDLETRIRNHTGEFLCEAIHDESSTKTVSFSHVIEPSIGQNPAPNIGDLQQFFSTFGSLTLYFDPESREAALYIAPSGHWSALDADFSLWIEGLEGEEEEELLPGWIHSRLVIGEIPGTGNYILVPSEGENTGCIFEFEHDGFEIIERAESLESYIIHMLEPDESTLSGMASHMRFIGCESDKQWWIKELRDNSGRVVKTEGK